MTTDSHSDDKATPAAMHTATKRTCDSESLIECESLPPRRRAICRGEVYGESDTNSLRERWGLPPIQRTTVQPGSPENQWSPGMPSRGLGDTVAKFTHATGLDKVAESVAKAVGAKGCGCKKRQSALNSLLPYKSAGEEGPS